MTTLEIKAKLVHAVTAYDRRQSTKKHYNHNALPQYFARIDEIIADVEAGADPRKAIIAGFLDRLQDSCLRACDLAIGTGDEQPRSWCYEPVALKEAAITV